MFHILLVRSGMTDFDEQGRLQGTLDIPLNECGKHQISHVATLCQEHKVAQVYSAPCLAAQETAEIVGNTLQLKFRTHELLRNIDLGLWHAKCVDDIREKQPKLFKLANEEPESICPPNGESVWQTRERCRKFLNWCERKHQNETITVVLPAPMFGIFRSEAMHQPLENIWDSEEFTSYQLINCGQAIIS